MSERYDIAVLGAGPAGCAAAGLLAARKLRVAVADFPVTGSESPLADWVPRDFWGQKGVPAPIQKESGAVLFRFVRYHDAKLTKQVQASIRPAAGSLVDVPALAEALGAAARRVGAKIVRFATRPVVRLGEDSVLLDGAKPISARLLLMSQGSPPEALSDLSLSVRGQPRSPFTAAGLDLAMPARTKLPHLAASLNVVASRERGKLGLFFAMGSRLHIRLVWASEAAAPAAELSAFLSELQKADLVPKDLSLRSARGAVWRPPAGEALDLETHSAKRCLLMGTAGGFADSITGQTLYPAVRSAALAARAAEAALAARDPQDALLKYKNEWRKELADSLRPPSTSVDMLLPLLMANQRLVTKFTSAMLCGRNI